MELSSIEVLSSYFVSVILIFIGMYCAAVSRNILRLIVGLDISAKGCMLALLASGLAIENINLAQALVILMIGVEVVFISVGLILVVRYYKQTKSIDVKNLNKLKG